MANTSVKVRLRSLDPGEVGRMSGELERHGLRVRQQLAPLGIVTGDIDPARLDELRKLDGVEAVETEEGVKLPPMDPDVPQ